MHKNSVNLVAWSEGVSDQSRLRGREWKDAWVKNWFFFIVFFFFFFLFPPVLRMKVLCFVTQSTRTLPLDEKEEQRAGTDCIVSFLMPQWESKAQISPLATSHCWGMQVSREQVLGKTQQERNVVVIKLNREGAVKMFYLLFFLQSFFHGKFFLKKRLGRGCSWGCDTSLHKGKLLCAVGNTINAFPVRCNHCTQQIQNWTFQEKHEPSNRIHG